MPIALERFQIILAHHATITNENHSSKGNRVCKSRKTPCTVVESSRLPSHT